MIKFRRRSRYSRHLRAVILGFNFVIFGYSRHSKLETPGMGGNLETCKLHNIYTAAVPLGF